MCHVRCDIHVENIKFKFHGYITLANEAKFNLN